MHQVIKLAKRLQEPSSLGIIVQAVSVAQYKVYDFLSVKNIFKKEFNNLSS
jgi:hypothetical protein